MMLWVKALHIISMVAWFSGLLYLPRLFVYHAQATDSISLQRFKVMEKKLYCTITTPAAILTIFFGLWLISNDLEGYLHMAWMHAKLTLVLFLIIYHVYLGKLRQYFLRDANPHSPGYYRLFNEIPALLLIAIVILVVVRPFGVIH